MKFYCVNAEFYDNFDENDQVEFTEVKSCITEKQAKKKPKNQFRRFYGMTAIKLWLSTETRAKELLEMIKDGEVWIDDLISLYEDCLPLEGRAA